MKRNALQLILTAILAFAFSGVFAQVEGGNDYVEYNPADAAPADIDYITAGTIMGYYAKPDAEYHPNYNATATTPWSLTPDFTWHWSVDGDATIQPAGSNPANYVEIEFPTAGTTYSVEVYEKASAAMGGCEGNVRTMNVVATGIPAMSVAGSNDNSWTEVAAGHDYHICFGGSDITESLSFTFTEDNVPASLQSYAYSVGLKVYNINPDNSEAELSSDDKFVDYPTTAKHKIDGNNSPVSTGPMTVENDLPTKYVFTLKKATDITTTGEGVVSAISHKSDYLALQADNTDFSLYGFDGTTTVTYVVNPAPQTGPIYHISNDWAY